MWMAIMAKLFLLITFASCKQFIYALVEVNNWNSILFTIMALNEKEDKIFGIKQWHTCATKPKLTVPGCMDVQLDQNRELNNKLFWGNESRNNLWRLWIL